MGDNKGRIIFLEHYLMDQSDEMDELGMIVYRDGKVRTDKLDKINLMPGSLSENYTEGIPREHR